MRQRILYIHHGGAQGGAPLSLLSLIQALDADSYECMVCSSAEDADVVEFFQRHGFKTFSCRLGRFAHTTGGYYSLRNIEGWRQIVSWFGDYTKARKRLRKLISDTKPQVVHFNSLTLAPYACVAREMGIQSVVHVRESIIDGTFGLRKKWLRRHLDRFADKVICICEDNKNRLDLPSGKAEVVYNPVDFDKFDHTIDRLAARNELKIPADAKVTLFAGGSVTEVKGLYQYLAAMGIVRKKEQRLVCLMPSFTLPPNPLDRVWTLKRRIGWLLGIYRKSDRLYRLTKRNNLTECIVTGPFTYHIERWIAACDVVCVPHIKPHFSRTVIEAGAMKKPVVAFSIGGIEEVVDDGKNGLLVPLKDTEKMAAAVLKLFGDGDLCLKLGNSGYQQAVDFFDAKKSADALEHIYEDIVRQGAV